MEVAAASRQAGKTRPQRRGESWPRVGEARLRQVESGRLEASDGGEGGPARGERRAASGRLEVNNGGGGAAA